MLGRIWSKLIGQSGRGPVILPTYDCNFRCPYCFERHRLTRGQEWLGHEMKPEMVEAVFAAFRKQRDQGYKIGNCTLYGGEPLLKENMATVRNICEHARAMGLRLSAITNGYDLDAYIGLLEEFEFDRLQITVDGVGRLNDRRRLHGSYFRESCGEAREIFAYVAPRAVGKVWKETGEDELSVSLAWPLSRFTEAEREKLMTTTSQQEMFSLIEKAGIFPGAVNMED